MAMNQQYPAVITAIKNGIVGSNVLGSEQSHKVLFTTKTQATGNKN